MSGHTPEPKSRNGLQWDDAWDEETWEEALLHHARVADLIYKKR